MKDSESLEKELENTKEERYKRYKRKKLNHKREGRREKDQLEINVDRERET